MRACLHAGISITGGDRGVCWLVQVRPFLEHGRGPCKSDYFAVGWQMSAGGEHVPWRRHGRADVVRSEDCSCKVALEHVATRGVWFSAGAQAEPVPGQWSYSLGPCSGIDFADQLWMSRFILHRLAEHFQLVASLDPKPVRLTVHVASTLPDSSSHCTGSFIAPAGQGCWVAPHPIAACDSCLTDRASTHELAPGVPWSLTLPASRAGPWRLARQRRANFLQHARHPGARQGLVRGAGARESSSGRPHAPHDGVRRRQRPPPDRPRQVSTPGCLVCLLIRLSLTYVTLRLWNPLGGMTMCSAV
jgi:hypothetical protein